MNNKKTTQNLLKFRAADLIEYLEEYYCAVRAIGSLISCGLSTSSVINS